VPHEGLVLGDERRQVGHPYVRSAMAWASGEQLAAI